MRFRLLGPLEVVTSSGTVQLPRRRERCLLGLLLLEANQVVPVDRLAELLWDGSPPDRARASIHSHVSRLRTVLAASGGGTEDDRVTLATVGDGYRLTVDPQTVDAHLFRTLLDRSAEAADPATRIDQLRTALGLWHGQVLADAASVWLRNRVGADLAERHLVATEDLMSASLALRREREILPDLAQATSAHPGRESLVALHMRALYQAGRRTDALAEYARARAYLADELGLDPGPSLRELHGAIIRDQLPVPDPPPEAVPGRPVTPSTAALRPLQLPGSVAGFTGRAALLDQLDALLPDPDDRAAPVVVTAIGGTAGVGKPVSGNLTQTHI